MDAEKTPRKWHMATPSIAFIPAAPRHEQLAALAPVPPATVGTAARSHDCSAQSRGCAAASGSPSHRHSVAAREDASRTVRALLPIPGPSAAETLPGGLAAGSFVPFWLGAGLADPPSPLGIARSSRVGFRPKVGERLKAHEPHYARTRPQPKSARVTLRHHKAAIITYAPHLAQ